MIKQKLQSAWDWTKDKARRFWKWGVVIVVGGVVLATAIPPANVSFESLPNVKRIPEQALYRITFDKYSEVEIPENDTPEIKLKKWGDETYIKIKFNGFDKKVKPKQEDKKLKWKGKDMEVHLYPLEKTEEHAEGFEFEIILKKRPATNKIVLNIETKDLDFFYQPELTQQEIDEGAVRPENIVGSYAVYHSSKWGNEYKAGKAFHIYRPKIIDDEGNWIWGEMDISNSALTITTDQQWLDNAVYPVVVDPTIGFETEGGTYGESPEAFPRGSRFTATEDGTIDEIHVYLKDQDNFYAVECDAAYYNDSEDFQKASGGETIAQNSNQWNDVFTMEATKPTFSNTDDVWLLVWCQETAYSFEIPWDAGSTDQGITNGGPPSYNSWAASFPFGVKEDRKYSIHADYTADAPPAGTNIQINIGDNWKAIELMKINIGDAWKDVDGVWINIGDAWKTIY